MEYKSLEEVEDRINRNYACIKELEKMIPLQRTKEKKLKLLSFIGKMYSGYVTGVYSSHTLEQQIIDLENTERRLPVAKPQSDKILVVMSQAGSIGGHTLLVHNWIRWDSKRKYSIVFTDMNGLSVPDFLKKAVKESGGELFFLSETEEEKAHKLQEISQKFCRILLFTHMEDIVPVLAYSHKDWKIPVYFYNHADWRFSFGFSVSDVILNLFEFDIDKAIRYRGISASDCVHLQFPGMGKIEKEEEEKPVKKEIRQQIEKKYQVGQGEKLIVSMGYGYRYKDIIGYKFDSYVKEVIRQSGNMCRFLIIGPNKEEEKWSYLERDTKGKARALGILPREEAEQLISGADLYVISFPCGSSGKAVAEQAGVPCLWLNIIGRGMEQSDIRLAKSVSELVKKTLDILKGNVDKYQVSPDLWRWDQTKWIQVWENILERVTEHRVHTFYPQRHIEKQEYVNCQLLQEEAAKQIVDDLLINSQDESVMRELFRLDRKYDMGLSWHYISRLHDRCNTLEEQVSRYCLLSDKHLHLYRSALRWVEIMQKKKNIGDFLLGAGYHTVAIYGMGDMGRRLLDELSKGPVKVLYGIDRNAENLHCAIQIFLPSDKLEKVNVIINTTMTADSEILNSLKGSERMKMLHLDKIFEEILRECRSQG